MNSFLHLIALSGLMISAAHADLAPKAHPSRDAVAKASLVGAPHRSPPVKTKAGSSNTPGAAAAVLQPAQNILPECAACPLVKTCYPT